jgi:hypothetical protein
MGTALYQPASDAINPDCPYQPGHGIRWAEDLPPALKNLVVAPIRFDVFQEFEMQAEHTCGRAASHQPCYSEFRFVVTQLCSDDDELYYEKPVYAESMTSWRLLDERWLVCRITIDNFDPGAFHTCFFLSKAMPR